MVKQVLESCLYEIHQQHLAAVTMPSRHRGLEDDLDRAAGEMMNEMPLEYRLQHGRTCTSVSKRLACGHVTNATLTRPKDCWICAQSRPKLCQPVPIIEDDLRGESCSTCQAYEAGATEDEVKKARAKERKMQRDRERAAANRLKRKEEQDQMQAVTGLYKPDKRG